MTITVPPLKETTRQESTKIPYNASFPSAWRHLSIIRDMGATKFATPTYRVTVEEDEDGRTVAKCIDLPGAISDGENEDDALKNIVEAISAYLESQGQTKEFNLIAQLT